MSPSCPAHFEACHGGHQPRLRALWGQRRVPLAPPAPHSRPDQAETSPEHGLFPERQPPGLELVPKPSPQVQGGARFWGPLVGRPTAPQKAPLRGKDAPRGWWALGPHPQGKEAWAAGRARQACRVGAPTLAGGAQGISQECHGGAAAGRGRARLAASQGSPAPWALCLKLPHRGWESTPASPGAPPLSTDSVGPARSWGLALGHCKLPTATQEEWWPVTLLSLGGALWGWGREAGGEAPPHIPFAEAAAQLSSGLTPSGEPGPV